GVAEGREVGVDKREVGDFGRDSAAVREPPDRTGPFEATEKRLPLFAHDRDDFLRGEAALIEAGAGASERSNRRDAHDALRRKNSGMSNPSLGGETAASPAFSSSISPRGAAFSRRKRGVLVFWFPPPPRPAAGSPPPP